MPKIEAFLGGHWPCSRLFLLLSLCHGWHGKGSPIQEWLLDEVELFQDEMDTGIFPVLAPAIFDECEEQLELGGQHLRLMVLLAKEDDAVLARSPYNLFNR